MNLVFTMQNLVRKFEFHVFFFRKIFLKFPSVDSLKWYEQKTDQEKKSYQKKSSF